MAAVAAGVAVVRAGGEVVPVRLAAVAEAAEHCLAGVAEAVVVAAAAVRPYEPGSAGSAEPVTFAGCPPTTSSCPPSSPCSHCAPFDRVEAEDLV